VPSVPGRTGRRLRRNPDCRRASSGGWDAAASAATFSSRPGVLSPASAQARRPGARPPALNALTRITAAMAYVAPPGRARLPASHAAGTTAPRLAGRPGQPAAGTGRVNRRSRRPRSPGYEYAARARRDACRSGNAGDLRAPAAARCGGEGSQVGGRDVGRTTPGEAGASPGLPAPAPGEGCPRDGQRLCRAGRPARGAAPCAILAWPGGPGDGPP
jgi:hypothetical protein